MFNNAEIQVTQYILRICSPNQDLTGKYQAPITVSYLQGPSKLILRQVKFPVVYKREELKRESRKRKPLGADVRELGATKCSLCSALSISLNILVFLSADRSRARHAPLCPLTRGWYGWLWIAGEAPGDTVLAGEFLESLTVSNLPVSSVSESVRDLSRATVSLEGDRDFWLRATWLL